ncbi:MAG: hypothetical protein AAFW81_06885 [Pseudomonadota bacterium]
MRLSTIAIIAAGAMWAASGAQAHERPEILTQFGADARSNKTAGVSVEQINGVHLYNGAAKPETPAPTSAPTHIRTTDVKIVKHFWVRANRRLRTQGFYSGKVYPTRRFTQGFYSGD